MELFRRHPVASVRVASVAALALVSLAGCAASDSRFGRHFDGEVWSDALAMQHAHDEQAIPEIAFLVATPLIALADHDLVEDAAANHSATGGDTKSGDVLSLGLGFGPLALGAFDWASGDDGRSFEVAAETIALTTTTTFALKELVGRQRPTGTSHSSFPSGHTSFAFSGATLFARRIQDETGSRLGYLLYLPAAYVGINRVEANRHFPSDVVAGAFLGILCANWVYNAHYGEEGRASIYRRTVDEHAWTLQPVVTEHGVGLSLDFSF
ncbi:MAG: phosphatase PAP2 family protein [Planctomycetes bacterium]|nr:phosphatase PAP2 family protein [Planctomycetota bacterium]